MLSFFPVTPFGTFGDLTVIHNLANTDGVSAYINYSVNVASAGDYQLRVHYAFAGLETNLRDAWIYVNGAKVMIDDNDILEFAYTGNNANYAYTPYVTIPLNAGDNDIRLVAVNTPGYERMITLTGGGTATGVMRGLANIESLEICGDGAITEGSGSTVLYSLNTSVASGGSGTFTVNPEQDFYLAGTSITLTATADEGYDFDSWTGDAPSVDAVYNLNINSNLQLQARFIPEGATQPSALVGFASIQSDDAVPVPYTLTGGYSADVTTVTSLAELQAALTGTDPKIIKVSGLIDNSGNPSVSLTVPSNTTIFGNPENQGHLKNIELRFAGQNYIVRNMIFSEVVSVAYLDEECNPVVKGDGKDAISLNGARHVWIDHNELYSSLTPQDIYTFTGDPKDFYDGLIDIKNGASFITLSNNHLHNHWKGILIGSGDEDNGDSNTRITLHHNFFEDINSRIPSLRYGKGHFYNNYVLGSTIQVDTVVNLRQGAEGLVEGNYIQNAEDTIGFFHSGGTTGTWNLSDNTFVDVVRETTVSTGSYTVPYLYTAEPSSGINASVPTQVGVGILTSGDLP